VAKAFDGLVRNSIALACQLDGARRLILLAHVLRVMNENQSSSAGQKLAKHGHPLRHELGGEPLPLQSDEFGREINWMKALRRECR
jgi:hypothetical protein